MQRLLMIVIALVAVLLVWLLLGWLDRRRRADPPAGLVSARHFWAALAGLAVLLAGLLMLELNASSPDSRYQPATIRDGKIQPPQFETKQK